MSSAGLGATTTLLGGSPSGQAAGHVNKQTQFTLVLGGGGMKGVAHVGVLQALTERGLVPSQIVGSSVGALVGAAWSAGKSIAELHEIAHRPRAQGYLRGGARRHGVQADASPRP